MNIYMKHNNLKFLIIILIFLVLTPLIYYKVITRGPQKISIQEDEVYLDNNFSQKYPSTLFPVSRVGTRYTLAFSLYSNNYTESSVWGDRFNKPKGILTRYGAPNVFMIPKTNTLRISIIFKNDLNIKESYDFEINDFKYQKWEHIVLTVNDRDASLYLNGKIIKGVKLPNVPWIPIKPMIIGQKNNNFIGKIKNVVYVNDALNNNEVMELYKNNI